MELILGIIAIGTSVISIVLTIGANNRVERLDSQISNISKATHNRINNLIEELNEELVDLKKVLKAPKEAKVAVKKKRVKK
jgi:N-glycosylase/DNA lyase